MGGETTDEEAAGTPLEQIVAGAVTALTLLVAFGLLALGEPFFWIAFPVGFGGLMPMAVGVAKWYESRTASERDGIGAGVSETEGALEELRARYARGELSDEQFEERVERLLETESVYDARNFVERVHAEESDAGEREREKETERE